MLWYKIVTLAFLVCLFYCMDLVFMNPTGGNMRRLGALLVAQLFASWINWGDCEAAKNGGKIYKQD